MESGEGRVESKTAETRRRRERRRERKKDEEIMKNGTEGTEMKGRDGCCAALSVAGERGVVIMVGLRFGVARVPWAMRVPFRRGRVGDPPLPG